MPRKLLRRSTVMKCQLLTAAGKPCPFDDLGRGLCHLHDPHETFARQHPKSRAKLLARADVQASSPVLLRSGRLPTTAGRAPA